MSDDELRDESVSLLLGGKETSSAAIAWLMYCLATNPDAQEQLALEAKELLMGEAPTMADLPRLGAFERAYKEAIRLYPPAFVLARQVAEPVRIAGYDLPRNAGVIVPLWLTHRDERWFPDPLKFHPDRFLPDAAARIPDHAYAPFGAGPRICLGRKLAMIQGTLAAVCLLQRYRVELLPGAGEVKMAPGVALLPRRPFRLKLTPREAAGRDRVMDSHPAASPSAATYPLTGAPHSAGG